MPADDTAVITALQAVLEADPANAVVRLHLADLLLAAGRREEALASVAAVLSREPTSAPARAALQRVLGGAPGPDPTRPSGGAAGEPAPDGPGPSGRPDEDETPGLAPDADEPADEADGTPSFDWSAAEHDVGVDVPPPFVAEDLDDAPVEVERTVDIRLADVAGMQDVKDRLEVAFLGPMRNPEMAAAFGKTLRGGLLLYGPPGVGKTYIARALAGEMGASFTSVSMADILDGWLGAAEKNIQQLFRYARRNGPCVLFFDEVDAIGHRRSRIGSGWSGLRGAVQQLLTEMDSVGADNEDLFVLGATNAPWDVDPALRRPGRFDRTVLVLPPDTEARRAMLRAQLSTRPVAGIAVERLVTATADYSGADLKHLCDSAAELALADSVRAGQVRPIGMADFDRVLAEIGPSTLPWLESARTVVAYGNAGGEYDDLLAYLAERKLL
ncbi:tetratricopeptide repeat protein [Nakamurella flavida]|uniref:Tetratricopeptide repeat protein n=1 Tax=Nakamurella flavida TaxID=363630 RepID=A0A939C5V9_9ACTN|nr:tetratricopeptide repeat protein [Nakamurella flavida]MBM9477344.1 tetratricopeptide repeat protein [Nakamurella flavida]MDP9777276.1 AAA+ superfamily predicted ATPase [Nakamurella flavida]